MPQKYSEHYLCKQVSAVSNLFFRVISREYLKKYLWQLHLMMHTDCLKDVTVRFGLVHLQFYIGFGFTEVVSVVSST
jgi:hypothetical protein